MDANHNRELKRYLQLKLQLVRQKCHINFLTNCKRKSITPNFIQIKTSLESNVSRIAKRAGEKAWLSAEISNKYGRLARFERQLYPLHLKLLHDYRDGISYTHIWLPFDNDVQQQCSALRKEMCIKHKRKFDNLHKTKLVGHHKCGNVENIPNFIINRSSQVLSDREIEVLNRGLNFATKPRFAPLTDIIADIESGIRTFNDSTKHRIRAEVREVLKNSKNDRRNQNRDKVNNSIKTLRERGLIYVKADKGNSVVIMDKTDYDREVKALIEVGPYEEFKWKNGQVRDPLNGMISSARSTAHCVERLTGINYLSRRFSVPNPNVPRLYALPKTHKPGMRPISSNINSPTEKMAKWMLSELRSLPPLEGFSLRNSLDFVDKIKDIRLRRGEIMVSFDVTALYPNVPVDLAIEAMMEYLQTHNVPKNKQAAFQKIAETTMDQNFFQFREVFYKQTFGLSMGSILGPYLANAFMCKLEVKLKKAGKLPRVWWRYVDDVFAIINEKRVKRFLDLLNSLHNTIKFTVELEESDQLPFLDVLVKRDKEQQIKFAVYRKPTNTNRFITSDSYHCGQHKKAAFHSMAHRLVNIPMDREDYDNEAEFIVKAAKANGYNEKFAVDIIKLHKKKYDLSQITKLLPASEGKSDKRICVPFYHSLTNRFKRIFQKCNIELVTRSTRSLGKTICQYKDTKSKCSCSGIYRENCLDCDYIYIGQTRRAFHKRATEHRKAVKSNNTSDSSIALHMSYTGHNLSPDPEIIKIVEHQHKLDAYESLYMATSEKPLMNTEEAVIRSDLFSRSLLDMYL